MGNKRTYKLIEKEKEYGEKLTKLIPRIIEEEGSVFQAARRLEVTPNAIWYWLNKNGMRVEQRAIVVPVEDAAV